MLEQISTLNQHTFNVGIYSKCICFDIIYTEYTHNKHWQLALITTHFILTGNDTDLHMLSHQSSNSNYNCQLLGKTYFRIFDPYQVTLEPFNQKQFFQLMMEYTLDEVSYDNSVIQPHNLHQKTIMLLQDYQQLFLVSI